MIEEENIERLPLDPDDGKEIITDELLNVQGAIVCPRVGPEKDKDVAPGFSPRELSRNRKINVYTLGSDSQDQRLIGIRKIASFTFSDVGDEKFKIAIQKVGAVSGEEITNGLERMEKIYKEIERLDNLQNPGAENMHGSPTYKPQKSPQVNAPEDIEIREALQPSIHRKSETFLMRVQYKDGKSTFMRLQKYNANDKVVLAFTEKKILETGTILPSTFFDCAEQQKEPEEVKIEIFNEEDKEVEKGVCLLLTYILQGPELILIFLRK